MFRSRDERRDLDFERWGVEATGNIVLEMTVARGARPPTMR